VGQHTQTKCVQLEPVAPSTDGVIPALLTVHLPPASLLSAVLVLLAVLSSQPQALAPPLPPPLPPPHTQALSPTLMSVVLDPAESLAQVLELVATSTGVAPSTVTVDQRTTSKTRVITVEVDASLDTEFATPGQFPQYQPPAQPPLPMTLADLS